MICFVPDGQRIIKKNNYLSINLTSSNFRNNSTLNSRLFHLKQTLEKLENGEAIAILRLRKNYVYFAKIKRLELNKFDVNNMSYNIQYRQLVSGGNIKNIKIPNLVFKTSPERLLYTKDLSNELLIYLGLISENYIRNYHRDLSKTDYKKKKPKIHGYGMSGLTRQHQEEAARRYVDWLENQRKNPPKLVD